MEPENTSTQAESAIQNELLVTSEIQTYLYTTSKWATFLAILGFIGAGFMGLIGLIMTLVGNTISNFANSPSTEIFKNIFPFMGIFYIFIAAIYFLPSLYLFQFAEKTKKAIENNNQELLSNGLGKLKSTFKTMGILTITFIGLLILGYSALIIFAVQSKF